MAQVETDSNLFLRPSGDRAQLIEVADTAANDSDKTLTVTTGKVWHVLHLYAKLVTTATVGNRQIVLIVSDATGTELYRNSAVAVQTASATEYYYWGWPIQTPAETVATFHHLPFPFTYLPGGSTIRVDDSADVDAAADDLTLNMLVLEYEAS